MDRAEAIKRIVDHMRAHRIGDYPHIHLAEALAMAISALREQANSNEVQQESIKTNADRIRAMTDEELANWLADMWDCHCCSEDERLGDNPLLMDEHCDQRCEQHCLEWLQQPAEEG